MNKLSVLINTKNEEINLIDCLESIKWVDEIIVVDMNSTDKTVEIAKRYTNKVYNFPDIGYVTEARNFGLNKVNNNWVLVLDADEKINPYSNSIIRNLIDNDGSNYDGFQFPRRNYIKRNKFLKFGYFYPDYQLRLFKKNKQTKYSNFIHELPSISIDKIRIINCIEIYHNYSRTKYNSLLSYFRLLRYIKIEGIILSKSMRNNPYLILDSVVNLFRHPYRCYIKKCGYMDGYNGLVAAINYGLYQSSISFYAFYVRIIYITLKFRIKDINLSKILYENSISS